MRESKIQDLIRLELGKHTNHGVFWRNNCGVAKFVGRDGRERTVSYGVASPGGSDLIGIWRGQFVAIEIKTERGQQTEEQKRFQRLVEDKGGRYFVVRSVEDAQNVVRILLNE